MIKGYLRYDDKFNRITAKIEDTVYEGADSVAREIGEEIISYMRRSWQTVPKGEPSIPGKPPAYREGVLDAGIEMEKQGRVSGRFGGKNEAIHFIVFDTSDAGRGQYALAVEDGNRITGAAPRPFIEPAFDKHVDEFKQKLKGRIRRDI